MPNPNTLIATHIRLTDEARAAQCDAFQIAVDDLEVMEAISPATAPLYRDRPDGVTVLTIPADKDVVRFNTGFSFLDALLNEELEKEFVGTHYTTKPPTDLAMGCADCGISAAVAPSERCAACDAALVEGRDDYESSLSLRGVEQASSPEAVRCAPMRARRSDQPGEAELPWLRGECPDCGGRVISNLYYTGGHGYLMVWECWESLGEAPTCAYRKVI